MPDMDGITTCEKIKSIDLLKETVITFLTARSEDYSQIAGFEAGADDYITKPIRPKVLVLSRVKHYLEENQRSIIRILIIIIGDIVIDKGKIYIKI